MPKKLPWWIKEETKKKLPAAINTDKKEVSYIIVNSKKRLVCPNCGKLLALGDPGAIEIKCWDYRCKTICRFCSVQSAE